MNFKTFIQFIQEAKKKKESKPVYSKKQVEKMLNQQGGIGGKAVLKYHDQNPDQGPRSYYV